MASCSSTQGAKLPRPGPGPLGTRDGQGSPDPRCSCLHSCDGGRGTASHSPFPWCPSCPPPEAQKEKPEAKQVPAPRRTYGPQEPATLSAGLALAGPVAGPASPSHRQACSPARHPTCLTCLTSASPPTWAPGPAPALPVLRFRLAPSAVPPARAQRPGPRRPCPPSAPGPGGLFAPNERTGGSRSLES